ALRREPTAALARGPLALALLFVPLPVQRHGGDALPQFPPSALEVVRSGAPDRRVAARRLGQPPAERARRELQDVVVRRAPDPGRATRPRRGAPPGSRRRRRPRRRALGGAG